MARTGPTRETAETQGGTCEAATREPSRERFGVGGGVGGGVGRSGARHHLRGSSRPAPRVWPVRGGANRLRSPQ